MEQRPHDEARSALLDGARRNLAAARDAAANTRTNLTGAASERAWTNLQAAVIVLLTLADDEELVGWGPEVLEFARLHLRSDDPRRVALEERLDPPPAPQKLQPLEAGSRHIAIHALQGAFAANSVEKTRARSFRAVVHAGTLVLFGVAAGLAWLGWNHPSTLELCFPDPNPTACAASSTVSPSASPGASPSPSPGASPGASSTPNPTVTATAAPGPSAPSSTAQEAQPSQWDIPLVELCGLAAAALTTAVALRRLNSGGTPFAIPLALSLLKLPAGAVSAVIGLMLIRGGLIPGLDKLSTQGQILAWAALFGVAQHALTRFLDEKGRQVLSSVHSPAPGVDEPLPEQRH
ncbi:hypothetical protein [Kitasatospora sp. NPDC097643]|uniref:hypothetical protein n=1 Tax=Kitasatospora sp. NPDC097643 TaxID=3157230 RepID=UPI003330FC1E